MNDFFGLGWQPRVLLPHAPSGPGVYMLGEQLLRGFFPTIECRVLYIGSSSSPGSGIGERLRAHLTGSGASGAERATHFWYREIPSPMAFLSSATLPRLEEQRLLDEYVRLFGVLPECNQRAALSS